MELVAQAGLPFAAVSAAGTEPTRVELLDPVQDGRWETFVGRTPGASVFHHRAWLLLLQRTYGHPLTACCIVDSSGAIRAGAPLALVPEGLRGARLVCLPFTDECPPLPTPDQDPVLAGELIHALDDLRRVMGVRAAVRGPVASHRSVHVSERHRTHHLALEPGIESLVRQFGATGRPGPDLVVERRTDARALVELHRLIVSAQRRRGMPCRPRRLLVGFAHLFDRGLGFVLIVRSGGRPVAGGAFLCFNGTLRYECGAVAAGAPAERLQRHRALLLEAVRRGCAAGMRRLELGRAALEGEELRELRLACGAEERMLDYHDIGDGSPPPARWAAGEWAAPLIRHSPPFVSRFVGETIYRWAAC